MFGFGGGDGLFSGLFSKFLPGVTGLNEANASSLGHMYMAAPPNLQNWLGAYGKQHAAEMKGPFEQVMGHAFSQAPHDVQSWANDYAKANHMDWLSTALHPAAPATRGFVAPAAAAPAAPMATGMPPAVRSAAMAPAAPGPMASAAQKVALLQPTPGRHPDIHDVDPRLFEVVSGGAQYLPAGYKATVNEGYNPNGHATHSQHHNAGTGALDVVITDPHGNPIPNEGGDPTGMYHTLARGAYTYMLANHPELKGRFAWGGAFGAAAGNPAQDLMHFDIGGERGHYTYNLMSRMGALQGQPRGVMTAAAEPKLAPISSNPDAALVHAAGMSSPSDPAPLPGLSSPMVPAPAPAASADPLVASAGAAPTAPSSSVGRAFGGFGGGGGFGMGAGMSQMTGVVPSQPLEAAIAAGQANQALRARMEGFTPDVSTSAKPLAAIVGGQNPAADPNSTQNGVFQQIFAKPGLAGLSGGGAKYRA
jgi:hypothetical protein